MLTQDGLADRARKSTDAVVVPFTNYMGDPAFDAVENTFHLWLTEVPRFGIAWPYLAAALAASMKWVLLFGFGLAVVLALVRGRASGA